MYEIAGFQINDVVGGFVITNIGMIVTMLLGSYRLVYRFAVLETQVKALHRRLDNGKTKKESDEE